MKTASPSRSSVCACIALALCIGCGSPSTPSKPTPTFRQGDAKATQACWSQCGEIMRLHGQNLTAIWFRDVRPGTVEKVMHATAARLRTVNTDNVDSVVIDHLNRTIGDFDKMGSLLGTRGHASLYDQAAPTSGSVAVGPVGGTGTRQTGTSSQLHHDIEVINTELTNSERETILHVRSTYGLEFKPWEHLVEYAP